jgi:hypothetical protein
MHRCSPGVFTKIYGAAGHYSKQEGSYVKLCFRTSIALPMMAYYLHGVVAMSKVGSCMMGI